MNNSSGITREDCQSWVISYPDLCGEVRRKPAAVTCWFVSWRMSLTDAFWLASVLCPAVARIGCPIRSERFGPGRAEDKYPHALIGFGGGYYRCPGSASAQAKSRQCLRFCSPGTSLKLATPDPRRSFDMGVIRLGSPCEVRYVHRGSSAGVGVPSAANRRLDDQQGDSQPRHRRAARPTAAPAFTAPPAAVGSKPRGRVTWCLGW
jgi:hypothetical protein